MTHYLSTHWREIAGSFALACIFLFLLAVTFMRKGPREVPPVHERPFIKGLTPHKYTPPRPSKKMKDRLALPPNTEREVYRG